MRQTPDPTLLAEQAARYPELTPFEEGVTKGSRRAHLSKQVRKWLKTHYPHTKFSVTTDAFSMGSSLDVHWEESAEQQDRSVDVTAMAKAIDAFINQFTTGHYNGAEENFDYDTDPTREALRHLFGSVKYVHQQVRWLPKGVRESQLTAMDLARAIEASAAPNAPAVRPRPRL